MVEDVRNVFEDEVSWFFGFEDVEDFKK